MTKHTWMTALPLLAIAIQLGCAGNESIGETTSDRVQPTAHSLAAGSGMTVEARRVLLARPTTMILDGRRVEASVVVEFVLTSPDPIPARALDPVIAVGDRLVREYRYEASNRLVFTEPEPAKLATGAAVRFQWGTSPPAGGVGPTLLVYQPAALTEVKR
jgi:hypothetical protein